MNWELAHRIFREQAEIKPGKWVTHSVYTASIAKVIAEKIGIESKKAFTLGLMHDIGRSLTDGQFRHIYEGYRFMLDCKLPECARVCLTHSFPVQNVYSYVGKLDVDQETIHACQKLLEEIKYTEYDMLVQLCDALATERGMIHLEERFVASVLKYGFNEYTPDKWRKTYQLKESFEARLGECVYDLKALAEIIFSDANFPHQLV